MLYLSVLSYLFIVILYLFVGRRLSLIHFSQIYLVSLLLWGYQSFLSAISLICDGGNEVEFLYSDQILQYSIALYFSGLVYVLFYRVNDNIYTWIDIDSLDGNTFVRVNFYVLSILIVLLTKDAESGFVSMVSLFFIKPMFFVLHGSLNFSEFKKGRWYNSIILLIITLLVSTYVAPNRSHAFIPIAMTVISWYVSNGSTYKIPKSKLIYIVVASVVVAYLADLQKQMQMSLFDAISNGENIYFYIENYKSNYANSTNGFIYFLDVLKRVVEKDGYNPGAWFLQFIMAFMPRTLFVDKPEYDLSKIQYEKGYIDTPLFFDFLYDKIADSSFFGVIFYHVFYLVLIYISIQLCNKLSKLGFPQEAVGLLGLSLVVLFFVVRGPIILLDFFLVGPLLFFWVFAAGIVFLRKI